MRNRLVENRFLLRNAASAPIFSIRAPVSRSVKSKGEPMANQSALRKIDTSEPAVPAARDPRETVADATEELVRRLLKASNSNEIAAVIGLPPIKGISGPKVFY